MAADGLSSQRLWVSGFFIATTPVTQSQYLAFLDDLHAREGVDAARRHAPRHPRATMDAQPLCRPDVHGRHSWTPIQRGPQPPGRTRGAHHPAGRQGLCGVAVSR